MFVRGIGLDLSSSNNNIVLELCEIVTRPITQSQRISHRVVQPQSNTILDLTGDTPVYIKSSHIQV